MSYRFPDVEVAFHALLDVGATAFLWLPLDFDAHLPAHHVYVVGGSEDGVLRSTRVEVATYAEGRDAALDAAEAARAVLTSGPHLVPDVGLLDVVRVDVPPRGIPYMDDRINQVNTTYRVDTRPL